MGSPFLRYSSSFANRIALGALATLLLVPSASCRDRAATGGKQVVTIGAVMPLSGEMAKYGKTSLGALQVAIDDANKASKTYSYKLVAEDDRLTPSVGVSATRKLLDVDGARLLVGAWPSSVTSAMIPVTDAAGALLVSPASSAPGLKSGRGLFFRTCVSDVREGKAAADYAVNTLHARRIAVLYIRNDFGQGLLQVFKETVEKAGATIVVTEGFDMGNVDFRVMLAKTAARNPDAVYIIGYQEMVVLFRQAREIKLPGQWIGTTMLNDQAMVDQMIGAADGTVFASWDFSPDLADPRFQDFRTRANARTDGLDTDVFAANAYDAVLALTQGVEAVGPDPAAVARYFASGVTVKGIWGPFAFEPAGEIERPIAYKSIVGGKIQAGPDPILRK